MNFMFIINLLEDLVQDSIFYYKTNFKFIEKIFEYIKNIPFIVNVIEQKQFL